MHNVLKNPGVEITEKIKISDFSPEMCLNYLQSVISIPESHSVCFSMQKGSLESVKKISGDTKWVKIVK